MDLENNLPVNLCTNPTFSSLAQVWPEGRGNMINRPKSPEVRIVAD